MYETYEKLLAMKGVTTADVCKATGISQSTMSNWKKRKNNLNAKNAQKVADYFGVSVDYLVTGKEEGNPSYYADQETAQIAQELLNNPEMRMLFSAAKGAAPKDLKVASDLLMSLKKHEGSNDE